MQVYNIKISKNSILKILLIFITLLTLGILIFSAFNIYHEVRSFKVNDDINKDVFSIPPANYTNVLKSVSENIDPYVGKKISISGYVYRLSDFKDTEFVVARDMIISSDYQSVVVGFLSNYDKASELKEGEWVELTGTITKGEYHGPIPVINVESLNKISVPSEEYVYPPSDTYIPTTTIF